ncbi:hypothetical protein FA95DRAFT_516166 [Auriscalpium vulgare]|uniref:Uncharacterized protein n=1 Tax=Auriscalpium vulgare TaxID=40419 RepID=A0ACB8RF79_9AGAM|nr:hypothetical protein FA95DRAFT_516166 [Auriscalpium vulgare]
MVPQLPIDVIIDILECLCDTLGVRSSGYKTLASCALVCAAWTPPAQKILFRTLQETTNPTWFSHAIRSIEGNPVLGSYVRSLDVAVYHHEFTYHIPLAAFVRMLSACPRVFKLSMAFRIDWLHSTAMEELARLSHLEITTIKWIGKSPAIYQFMNLWHKTVRFAALDQSFGLPLPSIPRQPFALHQLVLSSVVTVDREVVLWFLPIPSEDTTSERRPLRILELSTYLHDPWRIIAARNSELYSLTLNSGVPPTPESYKVLQELILRQLPPSRSGAVVLPKSLTHCGFHPRNGSHGHDSLRDVLIPALRALPHLRCITLNQFVSENNVSALEDLCRRNGATLTIYPGSYEPPFPDYNGV